MTSRLGHRLERKIAFSIGAVPQLGSLTCRGAMGTSLCVVDEQARKDPYCTILQPGFPPWERQEPTDTYSLPGCDSVLLES